MLSIGRFSIVKAHNLLKQKRVRYFKLTGNSSYDHSCLLSSLET